MGSEKNFIQKLHNSTERNFVERMLNVKVKCMNEARKFDHSFWDGERKFGYGGYKYIADRWKPFAQNLIDATDYFWKSFVKIFLTHTTDRVVQYRFILNRKRRWY